MRVDGWVGRTLVKFGAALLLLGVVFTGGVRESEAKLDPYYVLRGQSLAQFKPRVLIAMDTSGSMTWIQSEADDCRWNNCEDGSNSTASRVALARRAVNQVIAQSGGQADFSLMTFDHLAPPNSSGAVPDKCSGVYDTWTGQFLGDSRFFWIDEYAYEENGYREWASTPAPYGGSTGTWLLCGENRPFPYLRWDDAIRGTNLPNNMTSNIAGAVVPDGPLAPKVVSWGNFSHRDNATRKVQFFPQFMGQRITIDCSDTELQSAASRSYGDYGNGSANSSICGHTYYYWPYVDGFANYSYPYAGGTGNSKYGWSNRMRRGCYQQTVCTNPCGWSCCGTGVQTNCSNANQHEWFGVVDRAYTNEATLWSPFYSEAAQASLTGIDRGPLTRERANKAVLGLTGTMSMGGVDAAGGTPLSTMVGNVDTYVNVSGNNINPTSDFENTNRSWGHDSVASYLSFIREVSPNDLCVPTYAIVITDGEPSTGYGGSTLYSNLSKLRRKLDIKTYAVGFGSGVSSGTVNNMACAAAGSNNSTSPCSGTSTDNWDTCRVAGDKNNCGYPASNPQALADALFSIIDGVIDSTLPAGPVGSTNEFVTQASSPGDVALFQTNISGFTESPEFKGHVVRGACDTLVPQDPGDPDCADPFDPAYQNCTLVQPDYCVNAAAIAPPHASHPDSDFVDANETEDFAEGGSTCTFSRDWDAGECLQDRSWQSRRIYTYDSNGNVYRISNNAGTPVAKFSNELIASGAVSTAAEATAVTRYVLGMGLPDDWKLPGLATSTPVVVRRVPEPNEDFRPSVSIRDPHCAGRRVDGNEDIPQSLRDFAELAETTTVSGNGLGDHREYQEAVLVGSDFGLLHAFHFDSGNELFALLPPSMFEHIADLQANGPTNFGQVEDLANHQFGIASTINQGWAFDPNAAKWRHLTTVAMGPGGRHLVVLDVAHMGRLGNSGTNVPVEVMWSTETLPGPQGTLLRDTLGETWSRPALTYKAPNRSYILEPEAYLVFASGYDEIDAGAQPWRGQTLHLVDAMTGQTYTEAAYFPEPPASQMLEDVTDYGITMDPAVSTHCQSRYWGDAEEMYIADVSGRLYRWDLGSTNNNGTTFDHEADSGGPWAANSNIAQPLFRFGACLSTNEFSCSVSSSVGDAFIFPPAVISSDRIDEPPPAAATEAPLTAEQKDQFLVALASGAVNDDKIDGGDATNPFHTSLYILVDDHYNNPKDDGLNVTGGFGTIAAPGASADYMRLPLNQIQRERRWTYADGSAGYELRNFSKKARPLKAPFIRASLPVLVDNTSGTPQYEFDTTNADVEVYEIVFTVYEPGEQSCDPRWQNPTTKEWEFDEGSTYEIRFFLTSRDGDGFDLINGAGAVGSLFGGNGGLSGPQVSQIPQNGFQTQGSSQNMPCTETPNTGATSGVYSVPVGVGEIDGFSPREVSVP